MHHAWAANHTIISSGSSSRGPRGKVWSAAALPPYGRQILPALLMHAWHAKRTTISVGHSPAEMRRPRAHQIVYAGASDRADVGASHGKHFNCACRRHLRLCRGLARFHNSRWIVHDRRAMGECCFRCHGSCRGIVDQICHQQRVWVRKRDRARRCIKALNWQMMASPR